MQKLLFILSLLVPSHSFAQNWQSLDGPYGEIITGLSIGPSSNIIVSSLYGGGLLSNDNGKTWTKLGTGNHGMMTTFAEYVGGNTYLVGHSLSVVRSTNGGADWSAATDLPRYSDEGYPNMARYRDSVYLLYTDHLYGTSLYVTGDGGQRWNKRNSPWYMNTLAVDSTGSMLSAGIYEIVRSTDGFSSGFAEYMEGHGIWFASLATDSLGSVRLAGSLMGGVFHSVRGSAWVQPVGSLPDTVYTTAVTPRGIAYMGSTEGVHTSTDGGQTWTEFNQGFPEGLTASYLYVAPDGHLYVGTNGAGIFKTEKPVTGAYAVLPPQASVRREREHGGTIVDGERILILSGDDAHLSFRDVLGREVSIPSTRTERGFAIERSAIRGQVIFGVVETSEETRTIKLLPD